MLAQEKESVLLIENSDLSEYSLLNVRGMDAAEQYGSERIAFVLANTHQQELWNRRFSKDNKAWASEFSIPENTDGEICYENSW